VSARKGLGPFEGSLKGSLSPTRFTFWFNELLPQQLHSILYTGIQELWGELLQGLPLDVEDLTTWGDAATPR
jgi:hypothetical protein